MKNLNNTAFSLIEILLAAIIFVVTVAGVFATLNAVRTPVTSKEQELAAVVFGKQALETLRMQVSASATTATYYGTCAAPCGNFDLELGSHQVNTVTMSTYGLAWPIGSTLAADNPSGLIYTVSCADGSGGTCTNADIARKVTLNISYN